MVNRSLMDMLDTTCTRAARAASKVSSLESTQHLRNSGAELLRAVRSSLDGVISLLDPPESQAKPPATGPEAD